MRLAPIIAIAALASAAAAQSSCPLYSTGFDSFSDPSDLVLGEFAVHWCLNGASVAASSFCPTGGALRLDSSTDDPVILVHVGSAGCTSVSVSFTYSQFAATNTVLKAGATNATTVNCAASTPTTLGTLSTTGGACTLVNFTAQLNGNEGMVIRFDHGSNTNAIFIDSLVISVGGCCGAHPCCEAGTAGCSNSAQSTCVCAVDPYCCETQWDAQCVAEVESLGCGSCAATPNCATEFATAFGNVYLTSSVCVLFPELFESCEGTAPTLTISGFCAGSGDPALRFGTGFPYSAAITRCIDVSAMPAPALSFTWSRSPGTLGPRIDYSIDGAAWALAWQPATGEGTTSCVTTTLDLAGLQGAAHVRFRFASGSSVSNGARFDDIAIDPGQPPHDCCVTGGGGCATSAVAACVCAIDSYCCDVDWDALCVASATLDCNAGCVGVPYCGATIAGSCVAAHATPFCDDASCCSAVCAADVFCCTTTWDQLCAKEASVCAALAADLDGNGVVNGADLAILLASWGAKGAADLDGNGVVDAADLAMLLSAWTV